MNKNRGIKQTNFNNNFNGYRSLEDGIYGTHVNMGWVGLHNWAILDYWSNLTYWGGLTYNIT